MFFPDLGFSCDVDRLPEFLPDQSCEFSAYRFSRALPHSVWEAARFEGCTYTFPEVQTLLDGVAVGGHTLVEQNLVLGLARAAHVLLDAVRGGTFTLSKTFSDQLHTHIGSAEAIESGHFRGEGVVQGGGTVRLGNGHVFQAPDPGPRGSNLVPIFHRGVDYLTTSIDNPGHRAVLYAAFATRSQFYFDGNKRTARWMMNGVLMSAGYEPIAVPVNKVDDWNSSLVELFHTGDATALCVLLADSQFTLVERRMRIIAAATHPQEHGRTRE